MFDKFDYFNRGYIFGVKTDKYNPYINYTWEMLPNAKVKNNGKSGTNLQLYSGNPLDFQGSQSVDNVNIDTSLIKSVSFAFNGISVRPFGAIDNWNTLCIFSNTETSFRLSGIDVDFAWRMTQNVYTKVTININSNNTMDLYVDGVYVETVSYSGTITNTVPITAIGRANTAYSDCSFDYLTISDRVLTQEEIALSNSNPNAFYEAMVNDANTLFATDFRGTAGYIADDKNKVVGSTNLNDGTFILESGWIDNLDGSYTHTEGTTRCYQSLEELETDGSLGVGTPILVQFTIDEITSGTFGVNCYGVEVSGTSVGTYTIVGITSNSLNLYLNYPTYKYDGIGTISNIKVFTIGGVYPITNYSETMRTNFQNEPNGLQELMIERDSLGFFLGLREFPKGNGVGYGDTGWIPDDSRDYYISLITEITEENVTRVSGSSDQIYIGNYALPGRIYVYFGSVFAFPASIGKHHIVCNYSASEGSVQVYLDGVYIGSTPNTTIKTLSFTLCKPNKYANTGRNTMEQIPSFVADYKKLTQEEITTNYNNYVAQGLLDD